MNLVPVEIFRAGKYRRGGIEEEYPVSMLDEVVETFDLSRHRPPLIFSHFLPDTIPDREAADSEYSFGVPEKVERKGEKLFAHFNPTKIADKFKQWVKSGNLSGKSPGFYPPDHTDNPTPGKWSLREISALGTKAPVNGNLTPLQAEFNFADTVIEFAADAVDGDFGVRQSKKPGGRGFKPDPKPKTGVTMLEFARLAAAHMESTGKTIEQIAEAVGITPAALQSKLAGTVEFAEGEAASVTQALLHKHQPSARELELERQLAEFAQERQEMNRQAIANFANDLASKEKGILLPGEVAGQIAVMEALQGSKDKTVEFAQGEKLTLLQAHQKFLSSLKPRIDYGEVTPPEGDPTKAVTVDFAMPAGYTVDDERLALHQKAVAYQSQHPGTDYIAAYKAVGGK